MQIIVTLKNPTTLLKRDAEHLPNGWDFIEATSTFSCTGETRDELWSGPYHNAEEAELYLRRMYQIYVMHGIVEDVQIFLYDTRCVTPYSCESCSSSSYSSDSCEHYLDSFGEHHSNI
jgi:hypothetical protein